MKLLLHTCCGPCFLGTWENLQSKEIEITNYFYNPNIWPEEEYERRKKNLISVTNITETIFLEGEYDPLIYDNKLKNKSKKIPKRCEECYKLRLENTAIFAKKNNYDCFSTTLLVSPYQNHNEIKKIGNLLSKKYDISFYYLDFRKDFRTGQNKAREYNIYRQKYCGCKYSLKESRNFS